MELWAASNDSPMPDGQAGLAFIGVFSTPERALDCLRYDILGTEIVEAMWWYRSPHNDGYISGYYYDEAMDEEHYFHIIRCEVDGEWPGGQPEHAAEEMTVTMPEMHDQEFPPDRSD